MFKSPLRHAKTPDFSGVYVVQSGDCTRIAHGGRDSEVVTMDDDDFLRGNIRRALVIATAVQESHLPGSSATTANEQIQLIAQEGSDAVGELISGMVALQAILLDRLSDSTDVPVDQILVGLGIEMA